MYSLYDPVYGLKVGAHHAGQEADPNVPGEPEPELIERITAWANDTYRLAEPEPAGAETCMYTTTADESVHPRASRPARDRLALLGPRLQVRAGDRRAARGPRDRGRLTILPPCPPTSDSARSRASGTSSSATTGRC